MNKKNQISFLGPILFISLFLSQNIFGICKKWSSPKKMGILDFKLVNEASGMAISKQFPHLVYLVNDSGDGPFFYVLNLKTFKVRRVKVNGFNPRDTEALEIGPCEGGKKTCLYIADIGDNLAMRSHVTFVQIEEINFGNSVTPRKLIYVKYPDRAHDAEAFGVHPKGDLFIITKEEKYFLRKGYPAHLFKLKKEFIEKSPQFSKPMTASEIKKETLLLTHEGTLNFPALLKARTHFGNIITDMSISPDGKKFVALTYQNAIEMKFDLSNPSTNRMTKKDYRIIPLRPLAQQETISYFPNGKDIMYSTEFKRMKGPPEVLRVNCL